MEMDGSTKEQLERDLISAVKENDLKKTGRLLSEGVDANCRDASTWNGITALMWAAKEGNLEAVSKLIESGASVDMTDEWGWTALMYAAKWGNQETVRKLMESGAYKDATNEDGMTALMYAAMEGYLETVTQLIDSVACVDTTDKWGRTALMYAAENGHQETVRKLLESGAYMDATDKDGLTALDLAPTDEIREIIKAHIAAGGSNTIEMDERAKKQLEEDLIEAIKSNDPKKTEQLLSEGVDANCRDASSPDGRTALMWAAWNDRLAIASKLIESGASVDMIDKDGWTALMYAAGSGHLEVVSSLIQSGASLDMTNKVHHGRSSQWGHYTAIVSTDTGWREYNDSTVRLYDPEMIDNSYMQENVYLALYKCYSRKCPLLNHISGYDETRPTEEGIYDLSVDKAVLEQVEKFATTQTLSADMKPILQQEDIHHLAELSSGCWLSDQIINYYLKLISRELLAETGRKVYAFTTFLLQTLREKGYQATSRYATKTINGKKTEVNIFHEDIVLFPINLRNCHWALVVLDNDQKTLTYLDSFQGMHDDTIDWIWFFICCESLHKEKKQLSILEWKCCGSRMAKMPVQTNTSDCGIFLCLAARYTAEQRRLTFVQADMKAARLRIRSELLYGKLLPLQPKTHQQLLLHNSTPHALMLV